MDNLTNTMEKAIQTAIRIYGEATPINVNYFLNTNDISYCKELSHKKMHSEVSQIVVLIEVTPQQIEILSFFC